MSNFLFTEPNDPVCWLETHQEMQYLIQACKAALGAGLLLGFKKKRKGVSMNLQEKCKEPPARFQMQPATQSQRGAGGFEKHAGHVVSGSRCSQ